MDGTKHSPDHPVVVGRIRWSSGFGRGSLVWGTRCMRVELVLAFGEAGTCFHQTLENIDLQDGFGRVWQPPAIFAESEA